MDYNIIIIIIGFIIFTYWIWRLYYKIFDKQLKKYIMGIGGLLLFWLIIKLIKTFNDINILWYLYYIPLLYMPVFYYLCSKYLSQNITKIKKYVTYIISTLMLLLVLTNDLHQIVFRFENDGYRHQLGYFLIVIWIFYLLINATITLVVKRRKIKKDIKSFIPFIPILIGIIYTLFYVLKVPDFIRKTNITVIIGFLFLLGIEGMFLMDLIPNNIRYTKVFKNSYLPIIIISKKGKIHYQTNNIFDIPKIILEDIKNAKVKKIYKNLNNQNQIFEVNELNGDYSIIKKDYSNIQELKNKLEEKNQKLKEQEELLLKQKKIKDKLYEIKIYNEILNEVENKIEEKRIKIEKIIEAMNEPDKEKLEDIKRLIAYCKRMSNLIIANYNNELYNKEKLEVIINELLQDNKNLGVYGAININEKVLFDSSKTIKIYDNIFEILQEQKFKGLLINISNEKVEILLDDETKVTFDI